MKHNTRLLTALLSFLFLAGCSSQADAKETAAAPQQLLTPAELFSDRDYDAAYDESKSIAITLNGNTVACHSDAVKISDSIVTISDEGTYLLSGILDNGMIIVDAEKTDKIQLVLNGVQINSETAAPIYVAQADKVFLTLAPNTQNSLSNGGTFTAIDDNNIDAVIFSKDDLTLNGTGSLTITSPAGHGIVSKDDLVITDGAYTITAQAHGLSGKESVRIAGGSFTVTAGKDGIHSEDTDDSSLGFIYLADGSYALTAEGDGISASSVMQIDGGVFTVKTGGGSETVTFPAAEKQGRGGMEDKTPPSPGERPEAPSQPPAKDKDATAAEDTVSTKGIKAGGSLLVNGDTFTLDSADDALHANGDITVNGGVWTISSGDDGLHADGTALVSAGTLTITKSYEGIEGQNVTISGGTIDLIAADDGLNAAGGNDQSGNGGFGNFQKDSFAAASDSSITISGGILRINASGDGIDSNSSLFVSGGETYVSGPTNNGNGSLDYAGEASISGGIFVATGSDGMAQNFGSSSTQGAMLVSASGSKTDAILLKNSSGKELLTHTADKSFSCLLISTPDIKEGETYTVAVGENTQQISMDTILYNADGIGGMGGRPGSDKGGKPGSHGERPNKANPDDTMQPQQTPTE